MFLQKIHRYTLLMLPALCSCMLLTACGSKTAVQPRTKKKAVVKHRKATQRPYVINNKRYYPIPSAEGYREEGRASWYGKKFHGRKTANGETYDMYGDTAAHKTLPMGTMLLVTNLENNKQIVVRVNDRGPFVKKRIIDLTFTGAEKLGMIKNGTAAVEIVALTPKQEVAATPQQEPRRPSAGQGTVTKAEISVQEEIIQIEDPFDKGNFYIQIGAFVELENARILAEKFAAQGRDMLIQQYPAAGMNLYRVMVYSGTSLKQAKGYEKHLERNGYPNALVLAR